MIPAARRSGNEKTPGARPGGGVGVGTGGTQLQPFRLNSPPRPPPPQHPLLMPHGTHGVSQGVKHGIGAGGGGGTGTHTGTFTTVSYGTCLANCCLTTFSAATSFRTSRVPDFSTCFQLTTSTSF